MLNFVRNHLDIIRCTVGIVLFAMVCKVYHKDLSIPTFNTRSVVSHATIVKNGTHPTLAFEDHGKRYQTTTAEQVYEESSTFKCNIVANYTSKSCQDLQVGDDVPICHSPYRPEDVAIQTNDGDACSHEPFWIVGKYSILALKLFAILGLVYIATYDERTMLFTTVLAALAPLTYSTMLVLTNDLSLAISVAVPISMIILIPLAAWVLDNTSFLR